MSGPSANLAGEIIRRLQDERDAAREECGVQRSFAKTFAWERDNFIARALKAEAKLDAARELAGRWSEATTWDGKAALVDRGFGDALLEVLNSDEDAS